jgi:hypothetical protein
MAKCRWCSGTNDTIGKFCSERCEFESFKQKGGNPEDFVSIDGLPPRLVKKTMAAHAAVKEARIKAAVAQARFDGLAAAHALVELSTRADVPADSLAEAIAFIDEEARLVEAERAAAEALALKLSALSPIERMILKLKLNNEFTTEESSNWYLFYVLLYKSRTDETRHTIVGAVVILVIVAWMKLTGNL